MHIDYPVPQFRRSALAAMAAIGAVAVAASVVVPTRGLADDIAGGQRIWTEKAQCPECHGWAADGHGSFHSPGKAPSLRETQLTRDQIRMTIQCGRPGTPMPHFDRYAYTDKRCYDMTAADLGDQVPTLGAPTLQSYEIDALADYIAAKVKGSGPVTEVECLAYFKSQAGSACDVYAKNGAAH
jgi:mono/diheme cytochrome c family protein